MIRKLTIFLGVLAMVLSACDNNAPAQADRAPIKNHQVTGVSVWDRISTRSEPRRASSSTTLLSLGESFLYLDSSAIDSAYKNTKFLKARLSDSSIVWIYGFACELNAKPAVISAEVPLYMRPDLLTISDKNMNTMEIVAVIEEWDNWIKVVSEKKEKVGWIKNDFITYNNIDLAFALIAKLKLEEEDPEERISNLEELLENNPYPNSVFIPEIKERIDSEKDILRESRDREDWDNDRNDRRR